MPTNVASLRAELRIDSTDVATASPRITWTTESDSPNWRQASAELELDGAQAATIAGRESVLVPWPFDPIAPRSEHTLRVRTAGEDGGTSPWSEPLTIVGGFLREGEWTASMIGLDAEGEAKPALLRHDFEVAGPVAKATLYATAHGVYQVRLNGEKVDDQILKPGWTAYRFRLIHETTDVTALVRSGANAIGIELAGGWYTERFGFGGYGRPFYGERPAAAAQLLIEYEDGAQEWIVTDASWQATGDGPLRASGIYYGEDYDARREIAGWAEPGFAADGWTPVRVDGETSPTPTPRVAPAVRAIQELRVADVLTSPSGKQILDFGQNMVGRVRLRVRGEAGTTVTIRHAEVLEHGELGVRPLRHARATDTYVLRGDADGETWEPEFTFHGFRYVEVTGLPEPIEPADVVGVVIHSDMERTGWFESSHELLNRLHENVVWGMRGNFLSLPTDCPQRDERLGWTGDIQVFSPTASFLFDTDGFLTSWLRDLAVEQKAANGVVPFVIPNVLGDASTPAAAWGDAATVVPSVLHERFGDVQVVEEQFDSMKAWADTLISIAGDRLLWEEGFQFGDWLDPAAPPEDPAAALTDADVVASAHLYRSTKLVADAAALLNRDDVASEYGALAARIKKAFLAEYVTENGRFMSDAQTAYAMGIMFGLYETDEQLSTMGDRLAQLVRANGYRIGTGFVGTPLIADALTETGHVDTAARLVLQTENPSWLYPVTMDATTVWERWDSMLEDGTINPGEMTSFNHYALGAIADWLHRCVAGLAPAEPGYRRLSVRPQPLAGLDHASATLATAYGTARAGWHRQGDNVVVEVTVPANAEADVVLPDGSQHSVGSGAHSWTSAAPVPVREFAAVSRETTLDVIIDDPEAYAVVKDALAGIDPEAAHAFATSTWTKARKLGDKLRHIPPAQSEVVMAAVAELNARRGC